MNTPCAICAGQGTSCCNKYQIFVTPGDISRIADISKDQIFFTFEPPVSSDIEPDYDPSWLPLILSPDKHVRVLKRTFEKKCTFTSDTGCLLPPERRPLLCRLYPYTFMENGILGIDPDCPISKERAWQPVLDRMGMPIPQARQWLSCLYGEIRKERPVCRQ